jgi:hypothetical protein
MKTNNSFLPTNALSRRIEASVGQIGLTRLTGKADKHDTGRSRSMRPG